MNTHAIGTFEVTITPKQWNNDSEEKILGEMILDKVFHGDLEALSIGTMLTARTDISGSAGYVALERVVGTVHEFSGSFILQHSGIMNRGVPELSITVVPDSGTGQLVGLSGSLSISIVEGKHHYNFIYTLPN